jgi:rRNA-processing protein EBP2
MFLQKDLIFLQKGLKRKLEAFKLNANWLERLDVVSGLAPLAPELAEKMMDATAKGGTAETELAANDFQRELSFYRQAQATVLEALPRLHSLGIPTRRPEDYFAQMIKSDQHMQKVSLFKQRVKLQFFSNKI